MKRLYAFVMTIACLASFAALPLLMGGGIVPTGSGGGGLPETPLAAAHGGTGLTAFAAGTAYAKPGSVVLLHKDGTQTAYPASANTDVARGAALLAAVAEWAAGETLAFGPGIFDIAGSISSGPAIGIQFPSSGSTLQGAGSSSTTIKSDHAKCIVFTTNSVLHDFTIYGKQIDAVTPASQQPLTDAGTAATGVVISNIVCNGESDAFFPTGVGSTCKIYNSQFTNYFDCVRVTGAGSVYDFYSCTFTTITQPLGGYSITRSVSVGNSGTVRLWNCTSTNSNDSATRCCAANVSNAGGTLELHGGFFSATNVGAGTTADIIQQGGTLSVSSDVQGSGTGGALVTSGTIANLPISGTVPTSQFLTTVGSSAQRIYTLQLTTSQITTPAANTTYYSGTGGTLTTTEGQRDISVPITGTIVSAQINCQMVTAGSAETGSLYLRINRTTDVLLTSSFKNDATEKFSATGLSQAVTAGDLLELKWVTPAGGWSSTPATLKIGISVAVNY